MKARAANPSEQMRSFKAPAKPNFDAVEYFDMIDWALGLISELPVIEAMLDAKLGDLITTYIGDSSFPKFPCHTKVEERHVKLITEAAKAVCRQKSRDG